MRREFLMLAMSYNATKHKVAGYYASEKLDGGRCFWDGGLTRDIPTGSVPWANIINPKTGQPKKKVKPFATGLWSRYGNPIIAPDWFLNTLPACPLDGELWAGRGNFQQVMSIIKKDTPVNEEWKKIQFGIFGSPNIWSVMQDGEIKNTNFHKTIELRKIKRWINNRDPSVLEGYKFLLGDPGFSVELANLNDWLDMTSETHFLILQTKLPGIENDAQRMLQAFKHDIITQGGEGVFLRAPNSCWSPKRVNTCLKVKGELDDEGVLTGFVSGRKTDKGSKLLGLIGALVLDYKGQRLELSGLTDEERAFKYTRERLYAEDNPGEEMPNQFQGKHFKIGDIIQFVYRELTDGGIPREARYFRKRNG